MFAGVTGMARLLGSQRRRTFAARAFGLGLALVWLIAVAAPVRYFYCKMAQRTHTSACCADESQAPHAEAESAEPSIEEPGAPCCEPRESRSLNVSSASVQRFEPGPFVQGLALVLPRLVALPEQPSAPSPHWPIRAGPSSARELRALLQVFLN
jgi:hypothetical protein